MRYEYALLRSMTLTTSRIAMAYSRGGRGSRIGVGSVLEVRSSFNRCGSIHYYSYAVRGTRMLGACSA